MKKFIFLYLFLLIFLIGCSNNLPQQVIENSKIVILENKTISQNITEISNQSNETKLPENTYKMYIKDKIIYDYKIIILENINPDGQVTINVNNISWTIYQTKDPDVINGLEIQTLELDFKKGYVILEIKPFILKKDRYLFYKGNTLVMDNITNITLKDINKDDSIFLQILNKRTLVGDYNIPEGESITANNLTITNIKAYPRDLGYESHAILRIIKV